MAYIVRWELSTQGHLHAGYYAKLILTIFFSFAEKKMKKRPLIYFSKLNLDSFWFRTSFRSEPKTTIEACNVLVYQFTTNGVHTPSNTSCMRAFPKKKSKSAVHNRRAAFLYSLWGGLQFHRCGNSKTTSFSTTTKETEHSKFASRTVRIIISGRVRLFMTCRCRPFQCFKIGRDIKLSPGHVMSVADVRGMAETKPF